MTSFARRGDVSVRQLTDDHADVAAMVRWLNDPRVLEWWEGRDKPADEATVRRHYATAALASEGVTGCVIEHRDEPVGYLQFFPVGRFGVQYGFAPEADLTDVWACDMFIGAADRWGQGIGTAAMSAVLDHLVVERSARRVLIDPRVVNERAVHLYEKVGFRRVRVLPDHEVHEGASWDNWLMAVDALDLPVGLTAALARVDSVNPDLVPGAPGEAELAVLVDRWCRERGLEVQRTEVAPGRWNVVAVRRGSGGGRSILFNGHMDTVGVIDADTMRVRLHDGCLQGRGVLDTKGGLAAALVAAGSLAPGELAGDVIVAAVADEEYASVGTEALVTQWHADGAIVLEPTDLAIVARHRGFAVVSAEFAGRSSHTSRPERGVNAVHAAARATMAVAAVDEQWEAVDVPVRPSALVSRATSGGQTFSVPAACDLIVELRTTAADPAGQVAEVVAAIEAAVGDATVTTEVVITRPPMDIGDDHPLVVALATAVSATGGDVIVTSAPYWTDAALHVDTGTPAVVFGPTGVGLHEDLEWVTTDSLDRCSASLQSLARAWCV
jgi:acetylornithine deacetylase/succinyl-diaminopimelate desuccinylase-like protein/RimJ/RimL family protein N-acetyltransferase